MALTNKYFRYPDCSDIVQAFLYNTICMEGKDIWECLDNYAQRKGSGIPENKGCYFSCELAHNDSDRLDNNMLVYYGDESEVKRIHISEAEFYIELEKAFNRASFLFNENEWHRIQIKLAHLKTILVTN